MKTYKILNDEIVDKGKGLVNNKFMRFIGTGDSVFSLFLRSFGHRHKNANDFQYDKYEFVVYDKDINRLNMFREFLTWDGNIGEDCVEFDKFYDATRNKFNLEAEPFRRERTLERMSRHDFVDFKESWNIFKNSKFIFRHVDAIKNNDSFIELLRSLDDLEHSTSRQFLKLNFNPAGYNSKDYLESVNNILHFCWMRSLKRYATLIELADENNKSYEDFVGKLYAKFNPTFCILPWMHIQYKPTGQAKLCCRYDTIKEKVDYEQQETTGVQNFNLSELYNERAITHLIQKQSIEDSFYSDYWNQARSLTLENKPISGCHKCYLEEDHNKDEVAMSMRLGSSILYNQGYLHKKPDYAKPKVEFLEVGFGNYCNLACLSCNSTLSTTWHDDEVKLNNIVDPVLQRSVFPKLDNLKFEPNDETLKTLQLIKFTGGEPMINPEFIKFIDLICERGTPEKISLEIYTNCSYIPSQKLLTNLTRFKDVQLNLSIDAYGPVNDYIRYGSTWQAGRKQNVFDSLNFWLEHGKKNDNFHIMMSTTLSILNVFEIPKLMTWWFDAYRDSGNKIIIRLGLKPRGEYDGFFKLQMAFDPAYINTDCLPASYYTEILDWCNRYEDEFAVKYPEYPVTPDCLRASIVKLRKTLERSKGNVKNAQLLLEYLNKMDSIRGNSAEQSIPTTVSKVKEYLRAQGKLS